MKPDLITFDCAQTLLEVSWEPGAFAMECAKHAGLDLDEAAAALYSSLYHGRLREYQEINLTRDPEKCALFWTQLTSDWLEGLGYDAEWLPRVEEAAAELGLGPESSIFKVYEDVVPCLDRLAADGVRLAVISNWDYSLHHILRSLNLYDRFELVVASLEEGFEKPDPRIFLQTLEKLGVEPSNAAHIGDNTIDDLNGARNVGMRALLVDRKLKSPSRPYISSLTQIPEALEWSA
ncbi:MAG: hypothetical protein QOJ65_2673 [Fimbriimonadaceae bacterium]|jgi:putative hydrolase of the HAD superfamily|nr:hypothetical protein [Fimbriimonadaceae bacterium]